MKQAILTVDLGFGDAGKGSIVDFLTRHYQAHTVIRYNGGAQAGHRVVTAEGKAHVFAQFGSGTLAGANTHLSRFMLLDPLAMIKEATHLHNLAVVDAFGRTTIDKEALVITPFQRAVNRLKELARGAGRHGSCGMGIGETMADSLEHGERVLRVDDLRTVDTLYRKLSYLRTVNHAKIRSIQASLPDCEQVASELDVLTSPDWADWLMDAYGEFVKLAQIVPGGYLSSLLNRPGTVIFEGAQGVLLDEWLGFHPHTTWSTTTLANANLLLDEAGYDGNVTRLGITRAYSTRHGAGPFVSEEASLARQLPDACNVTGDWQQGFRVGWLDLVLLRYAIEAVGALDFLAVTCMDRLAEVPESKLCSSYQCDDSSVERIVPSPIAHDLAYQERITQMLARCRPILERVESGKALLTRMSQALGLPVKLISEGASADKKRWVL